MNKLNHKACFTAILFGMAAYSAAAADSQLLMYASKLNVGSRIAEKCSETDPRYSASYDAHASKIRAALKTKGLTEEVLAAAEKVPELSSSQYVEKFEKLNVERQLKWCIHTIIDAQQDASLFESTVE